VIGATLVGLAAVLGFHPRQPADGLTATSPLGATTTQSQAAGGGSGASGGTQTYAGAVETTQYGNVQVSITVKGGQVTEVSAVQLPQSDSRSVAISSQAEPILRDQALAAQTAAGIDGVSGATYTSTGYEASLETALTDAGLS
jgi:uncharacterized protein with FMN-binding domain